jgi:hypothetical protein
MRMLEGTPANRAWSRSRSSASTTVSASERSSSLPVPTASSSVRSPSLISPQRSPTGSPAGGSAAAATAITSAALGGGASCGRGSTSARMLRRRASVRGMNMGSPTSSVWSRKAGRITGSTARWRAATMDRRPGLAPPRPTAGGGGAAGGACKRARVLAGDGSAREGRPGRGGPRRGPGVASEGRVPLVGVDSIVNPSCKVRSSVLLMLVLGEPQTGM